MEQNHPHFHFDGNPQLAVPGSDMILAASERAMTADADLITRSWEIIARSRELMARVNGAPLSLWTAR
jgi:hypothetical protein